MEVRITKLRMAMAALIVLAGGRSGVAERISRLP